MVDSKFFGIPFAVSGDKATIPEGTQPSGAISYQQGYGLDYERDPETDPLAKRVPRDKTNELYYQITNAMRFLQLYGTPEWYAVDDNGNPVSYPLSARVRHDAGAGMQAWRSLIASNTTTPGANPAHWTLDEPFSFAALEASLAEALAGTSALKLITPRRLSSSVQRNAWNYAVASGTANAITANLSPVPVLSDGLCFRVLATARNTGPVTLNLNSLGAVPVLRTGGAPLQSGDIVPGVIDLCYVSGNFWLLSAINQVSSGRAVFTASGNWTVPAGVYKVYAKVWGGGGGGGGSSTSTSAGSGGGGGGYAEGMVSVTPGQIIPVTVGLGGMAGAGTSGGFSNGGNGGNSSFSTITANGGTFGFGSNSGPQTTNAGSGGSGGGSLLSLTGQGGGFAIGLGASGILGGSGGAASYSRGIPGPNLGTAGISGQFPGGGANGGAGVNPGGAGAQGLVSISW